jgi:hypothetical protein
VNRHASYETVVSDRDHLVIRDVGKWGRQLSVTNDAEWVVDQIELYLMHSHGVEIDPRRLFYYDSSGDLDEIVIEWYDREGPYGSYRKGRFAGFKPCPVDHHSDIPDMIAKEAADA